MSIDSGGVAILESLLDVAGIFRRVFCEVSVSLSAEIRLIADGVCRQSAAHNVGTSVLFSVVFSTILVALTIGRSSTSWTTQYYARCRISAKTDESVNVRCGGSKQRLGNGRSGCKIVPRRCATSRRKASRCGVISPRSLRQLDTILRLGARQRTNGKLVGSPNSGEVANCIKWYRYAAAKTWDDAKQRWYHQAPITRNAQIRCWLQGVEKQYYVGPRQGTGRRRTETPFVP